MTTVRIRLLSPLRRVMTEAHGCWKALQTLMESWKAQKMSFQFSIFYLSKEVVTKMKMKTEVHSNTVLIRSSNLESIKGLEIFHFFV